MDPVVRDAPLLRGVGDAAAEALMASMTPVDLARGDVLFSEGDAGDRLYVVVAGTVKLGRRAPDGRENLLAVLGPSEMLGELSLFDPGPRTATATAVTRVALAGLGPDDLERWLDGRPEVARHLLRALARRLRRTNDSVTDLVFTDVPGRVAKMLLDLADRFGHPAAGASPDGSAAGDDGVRQVPHGLTQEELAQLVGASRETVNKALADFTARGWIRLESRGVVLLDAERLARRAR
ncbi:Crp/Fnr family transcriptional regulator [Pseudokineococcus basanitobsidens]|uniref:Crp/Fnr family transcriptional regulator n=1 Tax=Pseudokineococcus basanitobsidens TaxID=1926649 RepID=A0ABU8RK28_9ACTN